MRLAKAFTPVPGEPSAERIVASALNRSWPVLDAAASSDLAHQMVAMRSLNGYLGMMPWEDFIRGLDLMTPALDNQVARALSASIGDLAPLSAGISFTNIDSVSVRYAQTQVGRLISAITESQRQTIRDVMTRALTGQYTVAQAAARIRDGIGLHPAWAEAVLKYRDTQYFRLLSEGRTEAAAEKNADRLALNYRNRLVRTRSMTIARTEIQTAQNLGRYAGWAQQIGNGVAGVGSRKEWVPGPGACPKICAPMAGETVQWDQPFSNGVVMPPAHPNCRCTSVMIPAERSVPRYSWLTGQIDAGNGLDLNALPELTDSMDY